MVVFQALTWEARDVDTQHIISIFGRAEDGTSVCVSTEFRPYFYVKAPPETYPKIKQALGSSLVSYSIFRAKDLWGFQNNEVRSFLRLNFATHEHMRNADYALRRKLPGDNFPLKVYESNIEPVLRLMHRTGIQSTGWLDSGDCVQVSARPKAASS